MKIQTHPIRSGFDGKRCLVHARCCRMPGQMIATAQYLDVSGCDLFSGLLMSTSSDGGKTWSEFVPQPGLEPVAYEGGILVGCDATPMYHKATGKVLLLGHTAHYLPNDAKPTGLHRKTFYSVYDPVSGSFGKMRFISVPESCGAAGCGNGSGQSIELENGELLIPVYFEQGERYASAAIRCAFDGETVTCLEIGTPLSLPIGRGLCEPSIFLHRGVYYMTLRNDECGFVARSEDGLHYTHLQHWMWQDGALLQNYNTQQHWMTLEDRLYLVYTRRSAGNDHVFRHRAPLFIAQVEDMRLLKETEVAFTPERGARLGNFGVTQLSDARAAVMAAEWMQPKGCGQYGSDNSIFLSFIEL